MEVVAFHGCVAGGPKQSDVKGLSPLNPNTGHASATFFSNLSHESDMLQF